MKRSRLIATLQTLHAGELAAALAYRGHAKVVACPETRSRILAIEAEEWSHRAGLLDMLARLQSRPAPWRERPRWWMGRILAWLCRLSSEWLLAWVAGRLERRGALEYRQAAALARDLNEPEMARALLLYADVEDAHGAFFESLLTHPAAQQDRTRPY